jgi:acyl carrier protein
MENLSQNLRSLLMEIAELPPDFSAGANLYLDLGVPSVKAMQLLMELEDRFEVQIHDEQFIEATSLDTLTDLMNNLLTSKGEAAS